MVDVVVTTTARLRRIMDENERQDLFNKLKSKWNHAKATYQIYVKTVSSVNDTMPKSFVI
ncbi:hypothetical protein KXD40_008108 [Peronospora effusa]|uniref:Uncharacterized protein n=1 Tax=Peronospora effusa TaxID=542832 RepID=A0A3M6VF13_9STRA|nr:hypothetical protein DD238_006363 [Peronospora effusa]RQM09816.1 hypothetical protein DD237_006803 [Peronospora effusa]UIZ24264.1 hypothetical protein KXD40_008108 [Peronospora effusa]